MSRLVTAALRCSPGSQPTFYILADWAIALLGTSEGDCNGPVNSGLWPPTCSCQITSNYPQRLAEATSKSHRLPSWRSTFWWHLGTNPLTLCPLSSSICNKKSCPKIENRNYSDPFLSDTILGVLHTSSVSNRFDHRKTWTVAIEPVLPPKTGHFNLPNLAPRKYLRSNRIMTR
jgi:hypothetical protein